MNKSLLAACTPAQAKILQRNPHLMPVDMLHDGDILLIDTADFPRAEACLMEPRFGPYVLTQNGRVQDLTTHYIWNHPQDIDDFENPEPAQPAPDAHLETDYELRTESEE